MPLCSPCIMLKLVPGHAYRKFHCSNNATGDILFDLNEINHDVNKVMNIAKIRGFPTAGVHSETTKYSHQKLLNLV